MGEAHAAGIPEAWPKRFGEAGAALWSAIAAALLVGIAAALARLVNPACLFVAVAPIVYEFIERPLARASSPRSTILGNALALIIGYSMLAAFRLLHEPSTLQAGVTGARTGAVLCAIATTGALLVLLHATHPPCGSTLLLVVLGVMREPLQLVLVFATVVVVTACGWVVNRIAGIPVPVWSSPEPTPFDDPSLHAPPP